MPRELHTAEEIRDEVARLLNAGRKFPLEVPLPYKLAFEPDPFWTHPEANWQMHRFPQVSGNEEAIRRAIMDVKARWDLM